jgi:hypothetical protein
VPSPLASLRARLVNWPRGGRRKSSLLRRVPSLRDLLELASRIGYGARGLVFLSVGLLTLLAAAGLLGEAVGTRGALIWLAQWPLGRLWLVLLGLGLAAFVLWRVLQAVFDADHEGRSRRAVMLRLSQGFSGMAYAGLTLSALRMIVDRPENAAARDVAQSRETAAAVLAAPFGDWMLVAAGVFLFGVGLANIARSWREDFTQYLACSEKTCRLVAPLARAGYIARGLAYLPLATLLILAGLRSRSSLVTSFDSALGAVESQPAGRWVLAVTALGFVAFGAFSFVEARFRRIRPPQDLG